VASPHCFHSYDQLGRPTAKKPTKNIWRNYDVYVYDLRKTKKEKKTSKFYFEEVLLS
jgi:ribosomal protein S3AE